ncbi:MAG: hypothetical protein K2W96_03365 [Gemmataceae bacterium]|nr:hypothetical protein [Gemmataceae bacterium]
MSNRRQRHARLGLEVLEDRTTPAVLTVNSAGDVAGTNDLTLREALEAVIAGNWNNLNMQQRAKVDRTEDFGMNDKIVFDTPAGADIKVASALPNISKKVKIDGEGFGEYLSGENAGNGVDGLKFVAGAEGSIVRSLMIGKFTGNGITIQTDLVTVTNCNIGVGSYGNGGAGILVKGDWNQIGLVDGEGQGGNTIADNAKEGVYIEGSEGGAGVYRQSPAPWRWTSTAPPSSTS